MIGYNFGLGFMPGPFCFGASSLVCGFAGFAGARSLASDAARAGRVFSPRPPLAQLDRATAF
ncbi:hypothetical protein BCEP4_120026 [Burkholderia cepacia]|nr:hypothetical protein BCEP4_120026 [Burkholderia cepacia]